MPVEDTEYTPRVLEPAFETRRNFSVGSSVRSYGTAPVGTGEPIMLRPPVSGSTANEATLFEKLHATNMVS